jgi:hypothetical protein
LKKQIFRAQQVFQQHRRVGVRRVRFVHHEQAARHQGIAQEAWRIFGTR